MKTIRQIKQRIEFCEEKIERYYDEIELLKNRLNPLGIKIIELLETENPAITQKKVILELSRKPKSQSDIRNKLNLDWGGTTHIFKKLLSKKLIEYSHDEVRGSSKKPLVIFKLSKDGKKLAKTLKVMGKKHWKLIR